MICEIFVKEWAHIRRITRTYGKEGGKYAKDK